MTGTNPWIERVKAADAEAEAAYDLLLNGNRGMRGAEEMSAYALAAIAAELRAARIARRPGAGQ